MKITIHSLQVLGVTLPKIKMKQSGRYFKKLKKFCSQLLVIQMCLLTKVYA